MFDHVIGHVIDHVSTTTVTVVDFVVESRTAREKYSRVYFYYVVDFQALGVFAHSRERHGQVLTVAFSRVRHCPQDRGVHNVHRAKHRPTPTAKVPHCCSAFACR